MYTKEQKERALKEFERLGSVQAVVTLLGYPSRHTLYEWYRKKIADITDYHGSLDKEYIIKQKYINKPKENLYENKKILSSWSDRTKIKFCTYIIT